MNNPPTNHEHRGALGYVVKMFPRISETFILREVQALRREGVPVRVYSLLPPERDARSHPEALDVADLVEILPQPSSREMGNLVAAFIRCFRASGRRTAIELLRACARPTPTSFRHFSRAIWLADRLRQDGIAHVHAAWAHTPASAAAAASRLTGIPWSMAAHAKDIHTTSPRALARKMAAAEFTLACTRTHHELLRAIATRHLPGREPDIRLAYHGVDTHYFCPPEARVDEPVDSDSSDVPRVLTVGRLVPKKGIDLLIDAVAILAGRGVEVALEIVGEGPLRSSLESRAAGLGLGNAVSFRGLLVRDEVREAMSQAALVALPCRVASGGDRDGIPNSIAEAMAMGVPVVSTELPSIEELVENGETGLLVPPGNPHRLADAVESLLRDESLRNRLARAARERVCERFAASDLELERARHLARALTTRRVLYLCGDRGVPVRGSKGASIHVRSMLDAWRRAKHQVALVTANAGPGDGPHPDVELQEAGAGPGLAAMARRVARALGRSETRRRSCERELLRLADNVALYRAARRSAATLRPDIVYERYSLASVAGSLLARRLGVPHVLEVNARLAEEESRHRGLWLGRVTRAMERWVIRRADAVCVVSPALETWVRGLGVHPGRVRIVPNGVDETLFHPHRDRAGIRARLGLNGHFVVGFSGTLKPWHGVDHLIRAVAIAARGNPDVRLLVMGDGPERPSLEKLATERDVADRVRFLGTVPHADVGDYLAACDALSAPYGPSSDGAFYFSPIKIAEYLACGRPAIVSAVGHLGEALRDEAGVILAAPGDEEALAVAIRTLATQPAKHLAETARSRAWTWADAARATLDHAEGARARRFGWPGARLLTVGYVLKMFPRFSETFILNEILELERRGVHVVVFSMKRPDEAIRQPGVSRVRARVLVLSDVPSRTLFKAHLVCAARAPFRYARTFLFARGRGTESAWTKFRYAASLAIAARREGVRHLHAHFASGPTRQAKLASMLSGIPFSFTAHAKDLYWEGHGYGTSCRKLKHRVRLAAFVVAISEQNRRFLESLDFKVPRGRIATLHNGLDLDRWRFLRPNGRPIPRADAPGEAPLVLAVGRLVEKKGFHVLIESLSLLRSRGVRARCVIAGEGPERTRLEAHIRARDLGASVALLGPVPQDRLQNDLYPRAHVIAQPSVIAADGDQDGIPTVILEAMALGIPVVTTPISGITEAVLDGETGLATQAGDAHGLADAIARVLVDDELVARFARGARVVVEREFDLSRNATRLVALMRSSR